MGCKHLHSLFLEVELITLYSVIENNTIEFISRSFLVFGTLFSKKVF